MKKSLIWYRRIRVSISQNYNKIKIQKQRLVWIEVSGFISKIDGEKDMERRQMHTRNAQLLKIQWQHICIRRDFGIFGGDGSCHFSIILQSSSRNVRYSNLLSRSSRQIYSSSQRLLCCQKTTCMLTGGEKFCGLDLFIFANFFYIGFFFLS